MASRIALAEIGDTRTQLSSFLNKLKGAEDVAVNRASGLWQTKLRSEDDIEQLLAEVESLVSVFENLPKDQEDLVLMRRALRLYQKDYQQLANDRLTWPEFEKLTEELKQDAATTFGEEEPPWPPSDTIDGFAATIAKKRKDDSSGWIQVVESEAAGIASMSASDANRLHARASNPPAFLTELHTKLLKKLIEEVEVRLDALKIDWLVEKFRELPLALRKKFLHIAARETDG